MTKPRTPLGDDRLQVAVDAALAAGAVQRNHNRNQVTGTRDSATELVTEGDIEAERVIVNQIRSHYPKEAILTEESGQDGTESPRWVIDPLDGTVNYFHKLPDYTVSIAIESPDGVEAGVVYSVPRDTVFTAVRGEGAYRETESLEVSGNSTLAESLIATGFPSAEAVSFQALSTVVGETHGVRRLGSAALDLAYVAAGRFEGFYQRDLNSWDVAAGRLLVEEAGGTVSILSVDGAPANETFLGTNGHIHDELAARVRE